MRFHFIESEDNKIMYFPDTQRFFSVNDTGKEIIQDICNNKNENYIMNKFDIDRTTYDEYKLKIDGFGTKSINSNQCNINQFKGLGRLAINITNACNLRCKYCYANGGSYNSDEGVMDIQTLNKILDKFYGKFKNISVIQIFGGEPLVSIDNIEVICNYVEKKNLENNIKTSIGLVTNGTLINDRFIDLVKKHNINVTVSYDGSKCVNDIMRVYENGEGTSNVIINNIIKLKEKTNQPSTIEVTYNKTHIKNNLSIYDTLKSINELVGDIPIHLIPAGGDSSSEFTIDDLNIFIDSVNEIFSKNKSEEKRYSYSLIDRFIRGLISKNGGSQYICDAGVGTLSVSINGDVYPCFMFTDNNDLKLGNIFDEYMFDSIKFKSKLVELNKFNLKSSNEDCKKCFLNTLCNGCLGFNELASKNVYNLNNSICDMFRGMAEEVILNLSKELKYKNAQ